MSVFLTFLKKTAKERWHSLASPMGDCEDCLDTPLPLSQSLYGRSLARLYDDVITKFFRLDGLPIFLTHGASLARFVRGSSAIITETFRHRYFHIKLRRKIVRCKDGR